MADKGYANGYNAGKRFAAKQIQGLTEEVARLRADQETKDERIFMRSLEIALAHCENWKIGDKKMSDMAGYCKLARIMADNAIEVINQ